MIEAGAGEAGDPASTTALYLPPFRIDVTVRPGMPPVVSRRRVARAVRVALDRAGAPGPASIAIVLSDDGELAALNAAHMGAAGPTDVLSFPLLPPEAFPAHSGGPERPQPGVAPGVSFALPPGARVHLGDVILSLERAIDQAAGGRGGQTGDVSWSAAEEVLLLAVHGTLHVCGWDHAEPEEEAAMRALERAVLADAEGGRVARSR